MRKNIFREILIIALGNFLIALSVQYFVLPFDILTGGVAGIAVALSPFIPLSEQIIIDILVVGLFLLGWLVLGKEFALKTFLSSILYPVFITVLGFFPLQIDVTPLLASIYAGLLGGIGIGIVLREGASTGGMDIPPLILNHYTGVETSKYILLTDGLTCVLGLVSYSLEALLNGLISVIISSLVINYIEVSHGSDSLSIQIISSKWKEIKDEVLKQLNRGVTILDAKGGYTGNEYKMLLIVIDKREYAKLLEILGMYDNNAFVITNPVKQVFGEGFKLTYRIWGRNYD